MSVEEFLKRCAQARCVVLPVNVYTEYVDGNLHPSKLEGLKYAALQFEGDAVGPDYWFMIEEACTGRGRLFDTAMEALAAYERRKPLRRSGAHPNAD